MATKIFRAVITGNRSVSRLYMQPQNCCLETTQIYSRANTP